MKVLLVICNIKLAYHRSGKFRLRWESTYREGLASIAAVLQKENIKVSLFKLASGISEDAFIELFESHFSEYDIIGFTMNTVDVPEVDRLSTILKRRYPDKYMIGGGVHPTLCPEESISLPGLDAICLGEGEAALLELCQQLSAGKTPRGIGNLWFSRDGDTEKNPLRPLIEDLDELPLPLRNIHTVTSYPEKSVKDLTFFMASRGCPYRCTYCCNASLRSIYPKNVSYYRLKSVDRVIAELKAYIDHNPKTRFINFYDDILLFNKKWFQAFSRRYTKDINIGCFLTARWELLSEETVPLLKQIRCLFLLVGVEVGNEKLRTEVLKRNQKTEMMLKKARLLRKHGVRYGLYTMVGLPTETMEKALETVKIAAKLKGNLLVKHHSIFYPFPGTPLSDYCISKGLIGHSDRNVGSYFDDTKLDMPEFNRNEVVWAHRHFNIFRLGYSFLSLWPKRWADVMEKKLDRIWLSRGQKQRDKEGFFN